MKDALQKYLGKEITLVLWKSNDTLFYMKCLLECLYENSVQVNYKEGIQIIPFSEIARIEIGDTNYGK
jgi:uncharacterized Fe-S radical SAM superfamily protein PflX